VKSLLASVAIKKTTVTQRRQRVNGLVQASMNARAEMDGQAMDSLVPTSTNALATLVRTVASALSLLVLPAAFLTAPYAMRV
jgi:hypothetical protein